MTDKFTRLKRRFRKMYNEGLTYREICEKLEISVLTAHAWRQKLNLPKRLHGPSSWMDERRIGGKSAREILERIAEAVGLSPRDIEFILMRFEKLKSQGSVRGRRQLQCILTAAYLYLRWEGSKKQPMSPKNFVTACEDNGYKIGRRMLLMESRLFTTAGLYPATHLKPQELLERVWSSLKTKFVLSDEVKGAAIELMSQHSLMGRTPEVVVAASLYVAAQKYGTKITQCALADKFGVTEVSIRNCIKLMGCADYRKLGSTNRQKLSKLELPTKQTQESRMSNGEISTDKGSMRVAESFEECSEKSYGISKKSLRIGDLP